MQIIGNSAFLTKDLIAFLSQLWFENDWLFVICHCDCVFSNLITLGNLFICFSRFVEQLDDRSGSERQPP